MKSEQSIRSNNVSSNNMYNKVSKSMSCVESENNVKSYTQREENVKDNRDVSKLVKQHLKINDSSSQQDGDEYNEPDKVSSKGDNDSGRQTLLSKSRTQRVYKENDNLSIVHS